MTFTSRGSANTSGLTNTVVNDGTLILDYTQSSSKLCDTGTVTLNAGLAWEITGLTSNGSIKVVNAVAAAPQIGSVTLSGSNLILTGSGGTAGADYWGVDLDEPDPAARQLDLHRDQPVHHRRQF